MSFSNDMALCECAEPHEDIVAYLTSIVNATYDYRDKYFATHDIANAVRKKEDVLTVVKKHLEQFEKHEKMGLEQNRAYVYFLKAKLINARSTYSKEAESLLSKAIKLDPKLVEAWNELGECYCMNKEYVKARTCFEGALKEKRNKVSLRTLSMLVRGEACKERKDIAQNMQLSLNYAKEAVQLDPLDGCSWMTLGNAYLACFFNLQYNPSDLKQCVSAYAQAEKDIISASMSDFHYNKGIIYKFQEEYKLALESFHKAGLYEPDWEPPRVKEKELIRYLQEIQDLVATKGKLKPKKLQQMLRSINEKSLGPYGGGCYTSSKGAKATLTYITYDELKAGSNEEKVILGKVVCSVRNEDIVPFTFCSIDKAGSVIVTTVFNLAQGKGVIIGDSVAIPEPFVTNVDFSYNAQDFKFVLVRVETPVIMVVNSKKLGSSVQAHVQMSISNSFD